MTVIIEKIAAEIQTLPQEQFDELLAWLANYELQRSNEWDQEIERDALPGGRLQNVIDRAHQDIAAGRTKPLDAPLPLLNQRTFPESLS